ncbi:MAG TPA: CHAD domain-containing protein [Acidimicrobiales bacterium]|nr:CHAD domain-containing protein [Acidimicrobiales bacterium]
MKKVPGDEPEVPTSEFDDATNADLSGAVLVHLALSRYAANFILNEVEPSKLHEFPFVIPVIEGVELPGHAPFRRDTAVERLHHSRVSIRRMRSTLKTFDGLFNQQWSNALQRELSWYASVLGVARDLEVMRDNICSALGTEASTEAGAFVLGRVDKAIADAHEQCGQLSRTERYRTMLTAVSKLSSTIEFAPAAYRPAHRAIRRGITTAWRHVDVARGDAERRSTARRLHRLRIELKRLQYAAEIAGVAAGESVARVADGAEKLQTKLGGVHDSIVARQWLGQLRDGGDDVVALVAQLRDHYRQVQRETLEGWRDEMGRLNRRWRDVDF